MTKKKDDVQTKQRQAIKEENEQETKDKRRWRSSTRDKEPMERKYTKKKKIKIKQ